MDTRLADRLRKIHEQIERLEDVEELYLNLKASERGKFGLLFMKTQGTVAEREAQVHTDADWIEFSKALVTAEVQFHKAKRMLDLMHKAYDAEHLSCKVENKTIVKLGGQT